MKKFKIVLNININQNKTTIIQKFQMSTSSPKHVNIF